MILLTMPLFLSTNYYKKNTLLSHIVAKMKGFTCHFSIRLKFSPKTSLRYVLKQKKTILFGNFSQNVGPPPPPPPFGNPLSKKIFQCLFCILEPKEHFCSSKKIIFQEHFLNNVGKFTQSFGNRGPPPPFGKSSQIIPYFFATG